MCDPVSIATVLTVASGAMQYQAAKQNSKFMRDQLQAEGETNSQAINDQINQIQNQAGIDMSARAIEAAKERARLRVASGEFGVGGVSPDIAEKRVSFSEGYDLSTINNNRTAAQKQAVLEGRSTQARTLTGIYQNRGPDPLTSALTIGANVAGLQAGQPSAPDSVALDKNGMALNGIGKNGRPIK